jgi:hypothetical protein
VLDVHRTERVIGLVRSVAVGALEGRVGACTTCATCGHSAPLVLGAVVLGADSTFGLVCLTDLGVVAISLAVVAFGG